MRNLFSIIFSLFAALCQNEYNIAFNTFELVKWKSFARRCQFDIRSQSIVPRNQIALLRSSNSNLQIIYVRQCHKVSVAYVWGRSQWHRYGWNSFSLFTLANENLFPEVKSVEIFNERVSEQKKNSLPGNLVWFGAKNSIWQIKTLVNLTSKCANEKSSRPASIFLTASNRSTRLNWAQVTQTVVVRGAISW